MIKWILLFSIFFFFIWVFYLCCKYKNPYKLIMVFGKKGSGKTTLITKLAYKYLKQGKTVYSTVPLNGTYAFNPHDLGKLHFVPDSVVFVDEVGMIFDNRNFKNFREDTRDFFKLQRHYGVTVYLFSQAFDVDKKLRDLTDQMYLVTNYFNVLSVARKIKRNIAIVHADSGTGESHLADDMDFTHWSTIPFGGAIFTFIPHWTKFFKSFDAPKLPIDQFTVYDSGVDLYVKSDKRFHDLYDRFRNWFHLRLGFISNKNIKELFHKKS